VEEEEEEESACMDHPVKEKVSVAPTGREFSRMVRYSCSEEGTLLFASDGMVYVVGVTATLDRSMLASSTTAQDAAAADVPPELVAALKRPTSCSL
jgi:hypothetical protein